MSTHIIKVPDIGEGVAEVEVIKWHVRVGDDVVEDQGLADIMTDKAAVEIPSPVRGKVEQINAKEGEVVAVGSDLLRIAILDDAPAPADETGKKQGNGIADKPLASPSVRRQAREAGIALGDVQGSGPDGRVLHEDLDAWVRTGPDSGPSAEGGKEARPGKVRVMEATTGLQKPMPGNDQVKPDEGLVTPVTGLRRKIAQNMQRAMQHIPHFSYVEEVDVTELEALRVRLNGSWEQERGHLTLLPFVLRAMALAVREYPQVNARYDDAAQTLTHYGTVHAGVAMQTAEGLVVPVLRGVEGHGLWSCAAEIARMGELARTGKITRQDLGEATISLTSLGALGGIVSTPIVNYPEVAIVGLNKIVQRPMVVSGRIAVRKIMNISSSFDHRIIDGAYAAGFIQAVRGYLECPATLFLE
ncbi:dihydrolipoamide acetyltransferase family protein [Eoetvoesiella caeni]|uniref:Dihydrolipoamide acetyltransferase component of pyruvate dehydrogenase complex n=1 Tax=Eoetvoesiella caeni TaxID=645616 RepID=A0A366HFB5_9BURK|nr:dihydrolipoamide acetyltransferase family protein [Eoetvoesiella caeni]MCI2808674.1 2-oxo acid dehydrogenase subunit E2 [Eoetvoesiella caeni]NYT55215.1 2-oxo acid dehydrogenase subunit E2 [Eoetvoesiella caeni]RBP40804.1 branched-chain alpha-keto acid dehydrogenase E2 component [Eoetvoesiella caeni]